MPKRIRRDVFHRWEGNPMLTLEDMPFRCNTVFNGTPVKRADDDYLLLFRVEGQQGYSFFALATSTDGLHWTVENKPVMVPSHEEEWANAEQGGIEDPRCTVIDGVYYIMYTAVGGNGFRIALARTEDFHDFERIGCVSEPGNKDGVLFPEKINGQYARLDRPIGQGVGSIWISYSNDLYSWGNSKLLIAPRGGYWDSYRVGASAPPFRTEKGWLEIYHGTQMTSGGPIYRTGTLLLDLEDPSKVISRCTVPLLAPRADYERIGDIPNVVFACGAIVEDNGDVKMYYGAADTCMCVATAKLEEILEYTVNHGN